MTDIMGLMLNVWVGPSIGSLLVAAWLCLKVVAGFSIINTAGNAMRCAYVEQVFSF